MNGRFWSAAAFVSVAVVAATLLVLVAALLTTIFQRKQEARNPYVRLVEVNEETTDPAPWGMNWSREFDDYRRTADTTRTRFGGSEALPEQKARANPWLTRMFAGYAFALDYRDRRGHAYMLADQEMTRRVTERPQPGSCLHCHASVIPTYRRLGGGDVFAGFEALCKRTYAEAHAEVVETGSSNPVAGGTEVKFQHVRGAHPVGCLDCHDSRSMELRVTRPGFIRGIQALAAASESVPHLASIERWRQGDRRRPYDPNEDATRQEMRSFVCGQCHVEYYCGPKTTLFFPWNEGLRVERIAAYYDRYRFPDGHRFFDWKHAETGAEVLKAQHPEFELWSQGIHARSGVACADCHMPYKREGAMKVSDHWVRSPLLNVSRACQVCHPYAEAEIQGRVAAIQDRTHELLERAAAALIDMLDAIAAAKAAGATDEQLAPALELQRQAQWRLDFVAAENSMGFHAPQEAARILAESIDGSRQAQLAASRSAR
ncbi:MAG TPA: ammonia-forming cytochrome c nitrite reductase subunit c552 [Candidatus Polarisedimenticolaceae bacterium]|nr:ammonia-forming cytochrome c nitrite reductase subunit c552 [Candidatus Polarisedimenticolaceae bacterium]